MEKAVLGFLVRGGKIKKEILLGVKEKGFGSGKYNGVGGRFDPSKDKNIFNTVFREIKEEIGIKALDIKNLAILDFHHPYLQNRRRKSWRVYAFLITDWQGRPKKSKEMKPRWFRINKIPFDKMWPDRKFWLPKVLKGEKVKPKFLYKDDNTIESYQI